MKLTLFQVDFSSSIRSESASMINCQGIQYQLKFWDKRESWIYTRCQIPFSEDNPEAVSSNCVSRSLKPLLIFSRLLIPWSNLSLLCTCSERSCLRLPSSKYSKINLFSNWQTKKRTDYVLGRASNSTKNGRLDLIRTMGGASENHPTKKPGAVLGAKATRIAGTIKKSKLSSPSSERLRWRSFRSFDFRSPHTLMNLD